MSNIQTCLVLGATGFIGGHIAQAALKDGYQVRGLRRDPQAVGHVGDAPVEWHSGNLDDQESLVKAMQGVEVVFHAAGYYPTRSKPKEVPEQVAYAEGQIDRVIAATRLAGVKRLVYTSTLTTIGHPLSGVRRLADETDHYQLGSLAKSGYYEAKSAMEARLIAAAKDDLPVVITNPTAVFGPGDVHLTLGRILLAVRRRLVIAWIPVTINVIDVRDVAAGHIAAAKKGRLGERYILGSYNTSVKTLIDLMASQCKVRPPFFEISIATIEKVVKFIDLFPLLSSGNHLRALPNWQSYNTEKAEKELGLMHRPFEQTVADAIEWFRQNDVKI